tara:strand:- start:1934 stop:2227 length:294 start_codon:yes stop_codon:yes gene_type:complete
MDIKMRNDVSPLIWVGLTIGMVVVYWGIGQIHSNLCTPKGISGLLYTAIAMSSPICQAIINILGYSSSIYFIIWSGIVGSIISTGWQITRYLGLRGK